MPDQALEAARAALSLVASAQPNDVAAFAIAADADGHDVVTSVEVSGSLSLDFLSAAKGMAASLVDASPRPYAPAAELSRGEIMWIGSHVGSLETLDPQIDQGDVDVYSQSADYAKRLRFLVVRVTVGDKRVKFYRAIAPAAWLGRTKKVALFWADGRFDKLNTESVLLFDGHFDAVVADDVAFFSSKYTFERIFSFGEQVAAQSKVTFRAIVSGLRISGQTEMEHACTTNPGMMAKLASVQRSMDSYPGYTLAMTMEKLLPFIYSHPETGVEVSGSGDSAELVFHNDPARRFKILRLLDGDFLQSELTENTYEANSKSDPLS